MKHRKKQLLGIFGLLAVAAMTAIASLIPAGSAAAIDGPETTIQVQVVVGEPDDPNNPGGGPSSNIPMIDIQTPADGSTITSDTVNVSARYRNVKDVKYYLRYTDKDGHEQTIEVASFETDGASGTNEFQLDLTPYKSALGDVDFQLIAKATSENGVSYEDVVRFSYRGVYVEMSGETAKNDDPIVDVSFNKDVAKITMQVYDKDGNPVFVNANGEEEPLVFDASDLDYDKLYKQVILPMEKYGAKPGDYQLMTLAYNAAGEMISMNLTNFRYRPDWIKNPNTGSVFADTNISRTDYLLTGLIIFGAVAGFAGFLVLRKKNNR